jgi:hypothetical protein
MMGLEIVQMPSLIGRFFLSRAAYWRTGCVQKPMLLMKLPFKPEKNVCDILPLTLDQTKAEKLEYSSPVSFEKVKATVFPPSKIVKLSDLLPLKTKLFSAGSYWASYVVTASRSSQVEHDNSMVSAKACVDQTSTVTASTLMFFILNKTPLKNVFRSFI